MASSKSPARPRLRKPVIVILLSQPSGTGRRSDRSQVHAAVGVFGGRRSRDAHAAAAAQTYEKLLVRKDYAPRHKVSDNIKKCQRHLPVSAPLHGWPDRT